MPLISEDCFLELQEALTGLAYDPADPKDLILQLEGIIDLASRLIELITELPGNIRKIEGEDR